MGAGSIGTVPAKIIDVLAATLPATQAGKGA
jgi:hypothetical protein